MLLLGLLACGAAAAQSAATAAADAPLVVYAAGDIADCRYGRPQYAGAAQTAALIDDGLRDARRLGRRAAVLSLGDHTYPDGLAAEFRDCYHVSWGRFKADTYPTIGNHEYYSGSADGYYGYFGAAAGPRGRGYYSFDLGGWHLISLNSHMKGAEHAAQLLWLKDDLARHPRRCTLAYWHAPLYSSGGHRSNPHMQAVWRALHAAGAALVLSGHDHDYERFAPQDADGRPDARGPRQFVVGTGGAYLTPFRWIQPHSEARQNSRHGVLRLELRADSYAWQYVAVDAQPPPDVPEAEQQDHGSARCHQPIQ